MATPLIAPLDLTGKKFSRWTVLGDASCYDDKHRRYKCVCDCGREKDIARTSLLKGTSRSCGCLNSEVLATRNRIHGRSHSPEYYAWCNFRRRCMDPKTRNYDKYGGRGIAVCNRWRNDFATFYADMGPRPSAGHSIDRIDNDGNYEPRNCRWATKTKQMNNMSTNRKVTACGVTRTLAEWALLCGLNRRTIAARISYGWSTQSAINTPVS